MDSPLTKRAPCAVCGLTTIQHVGWFLLIENRWLDRLKVFSWHPALAAQPETKSACCREHLKSLVELWLDQASLPQSTSHSRPLPIAGPPDRDDRDFDALSPGQLLGELSVCRDRFTRGWTGSSTTLECILDALVPERPDYKSFAVDLPLLDPCRGSHHGLALH